MQEVPVILEKISGQSTVEVCTTVSMEIHKYVQVIDFI